MAAAECIEGWMEVSEMADESNDARGTMEGDRGDSKAQPSGPRGDNPATAGPGETQVGSATSENADSQINPSAPGETGTTPGQDGHGMVHGHRGPRIPHG